MHPVVIVGASLGALRTAESLRRFGYPGAITIIGDEPHLPYNRPPLSKAALSTPVNHSELAFALQDEVSDVQWMLGTTVTAASLNERTVTDASGRVHSYSVLVAATGMRPRRIDPQHDLRSGRVALRSLDDATQLRDQLRPGARVVVAGAGFIGCEVAATARTLGCDVTVIGSEVHPMQRQLGAELAAELQRRHESHGVRFHLGTRVESIVGTDRVSRVQLADGAVLECDVLVDAIGAVPNTEWLRGNDLDLAAGILTDAALRGVRTTGDAWPDFFAVGDVARFPNATYDGDAFAIGHWNIPSETAKRAAKVIAAALSGSPEHHDDVVAERFAPVPSFWSDQFEMHLLAYGMLGLADRAKLIHGELSSDSVFGYFRGETLVGVCGLGMRSTVLKYRDRVGSAWSDAQLIS